MTEYVLIILAFILTVEVTPWLTWLTHHITGWHWGIALLVALPMGFISTCLLGLIAFFGMYFVESRLAPPPSDSTGLPMLSIILMPMVVHVPMLVHVLHQWRGWQGFTLYAAAFGVGLLLTIGAKAVMGGMIVGVNVLIERIASRKEKQKPAAHAAASGDLGDN